MYTSQLRLMSSKIENTVVSSGIWQLGNFVLNKEELILVDKCESLLIGTQNTSCGPIAKIGCSFTSDEIF